MWRRLEGWWCRENVWETNIIVTVTVTDDVAVCQTRETAASRQPAGIYWRLPAAWRHRAGTTSHQCTSRHLVSVHVCCRRLAYVRVLHYVVVISCLMSVTLYTYLRRKAATDKLVSCSIVSSRDKSTVWMNWNGGSLMSDAVLNSWFLMRLLTSGEEDIERMSVLREDISNTICELTVLILSISVTFNVTCLTVTSLFTTSCQHRWSIHSCMGARRIFCRWGQTVALTKARENFFKSCMLLYTSFSAFLGELKLILYQCFLSWHFSF